jgi:hypothetical protein
MYLVDIALVPELTIDKLPLILTDTAVALLPPYTVGILTLQICAEVIPAFIKQVIGGISILSL